MLMDLPDKHQRQKKLFVIRLIFSLFKKVLHSVNDFLTNAVRIHGSQRHDGFVDCRRLFSVVMATFYPLLVVAGCSAVVIVIIVLKVEDGCGCSRMCRFQNFEFLI
jgi:hypothetical protein